jgi:hypothetical protein
LADFTSFYWEIISVVIQFQISKLLHLVMPIELGPECRLGGFVSDSQASQSLCGISLLINWVIWTAVREKGDLLVPVPVGHPYKGFSGFISCSLLSFWIEFEHIVRSWFLLFDDQN